MHQNNSKLQFSIQATAVSIIIIISFVLPP